MKPTLTPQQFAATWANVHLKESASYVTHFDDLCALVGHPKPAHMDKTGATFTYQKGALKEQAGEIVGHGFADVWYKDHFAFEYKGAGQHKTLVEAFKQLQQYSGALENPPLLVVCDIERYEVHANFNGAVSAVYRFTNADLATDADVAGTRFTAFQILQQLFFDPEALRPSKTISSVTIDAARRFAELSESIHKKNRKLEALHVARFLIKIMFCLFCEDVGLLPKGLFADIVAQTMGHEGKFTRNLRELFQAMSTGGDMWGRDIPHFNGGLFYANDAEQDVINLDGIDARNVLSAAQLNWADVDPSIFGSLFERALDIEGRRAELGAHYTSREDIETIVRPVLIEPLLREWGEVKLSTGKLAAKGKPQTAIKKLIGKFLDRLAVLTVLDPACGSGNFLYVSLKLLKDLEQQVITYAVSLGIDDFEPRVNPAQLYGIEKDHFAHQLASIVVWIGYLQWKLKNGYEPAGETPILKPLNNIQCLDAILDFTLTPTLSHTASRPAASQTREGRGSHPSPSKGEGQGMRVASEPTWPAAEVIVGNPPFLGDKKMRAELGDAYVEALRELYGDRIPGQSDLCCYWFEKARAMIAARKTKRAGLLATNSIRGGANREVLKRIKETGDIFWAISDRDWYLDGAAVNVSMVGFDDGMEKQHTLDHRLVSNINSDLTSLANLTQAQGLAENMNISFVGPSPHGSFDITANIARYMLSAPPNPNGRSNADVIRQVVSATDIVQTFRGMWTIDFGVMSESDSALYELPFEYVKKHVYPERTKNHRAAYAEKWWQYAEARPGMREALKEKSRYMATPRISKHRIFVWIKPEVLANDGTIVFALEDDYSFGILHSHIHEVWALRQGTSLEDRPRYTPTTTFETFPFPWPPGQEPSKTSEVFTDNQARSDDRSTRQAGKAIQQVKTSEVSLEQAIAQAANELVELRDNWLNPYKDQPAGLDVTLKKRTLTNLYNENPTWLQNAHRKLDEAVFAAYGWPSNLNDDEILARLLALNLQRAGK